MTTPTAVIAKCILRWLYEQASAILKALRAFIEMLIALIDAQILALRAAIAAIDPARILQEYVWSVVEQIIDELRNLLNSGIPGPGADLCPEFYQYFSNPAIALLESALAAFLPYKDQFMNLISLTDKFDRLLVYWVATKAQLLAILDVLDDALYNALIVEAAEEAEAL
jgi:hypothetical protein